MDNEVFTINIISRIGYGIMVIALPYYIPSNLELIGIILAAYPIAEALASVPVGFLVSRVGVRRLVAGGLLIMATSSVLFTLSSNWVALAILHGLMGIAAAMVIVPLLALVTYRRVKLGLRYGGFFATYFSGYIIGLGISGLMQGFIKSSIEASKVSMVTAAVIFTSALVLVTSISDRGGVNVTTKPRLRREELILLPLWLGIMVLLGIAFALPRSLSTHFNISGGYVSLIYVLAAIVLALGIMLFGSLTDRIGATRVMAVGLIGLSLVIATAYLVASGWLSISYAMVPLAPSALLASALVPSIYTYIGHRLESGSEGLVMGVYNVPTAIGIAIGNLVGGFSLNRLGLGSTVALAGLVLAVAIALTAVLWFTFTQWRRH